MKSLIDVFLMQGVSGKVRANIIVQLGQAINHEHGANITEPLVYELVKQIDPENEVLYDEHYIYMAKKNGVDTYDLRGKKAPAVVQTIDVNTRWEQGIAHDPRSKEMVRWIAAYDFEFCDDYFCWKVGGDGDNGETLMYELDEYFAAKDLVVLTRQQPNKE
jgi:hypothetical protein